MKDESGKRKDESGKVKSGSWKREDENGKRKVGRELPGATLLRMVEDLVFSSATAPAFAPACIRAGSSSRLSALTSEFESRF